VSLTDDAQIPVNKRGSGVRRLILLNFFRAKVEKKRNEQGRSQVIYAVEEPETSQHPDNQKMLLDALVELSEDTDCQVLLSTHTPMLGALAPLQSLRYLEIRPDHTRTLHLGNDTTYQMVADALGVLPDNRVKIFLCVEGINDENYLRRISAILHSGDESLSSLGDMEKRGELIFMPACGNLRLWVNRLAELNRPEFHLYDREMAPTTKEREELVLQIKQRAGCDALLTTKRQMENYLHPKAITTARPGIEVKVTDEEDVPLVVAKAVQALTKGGKPWENLSKDTKRKKIDHAKRWLNTDAAAQMTPELLDEIDTNQEVKGWLRKISEMAAQAS